MPLLQVASGVSIAYEIAGAGAPIVLVHGFASNRGINWRAPGWYATLTDAGRQVIALDVRGHGESSKPHDPAAYDEGELAADITRLLDHLGHQCADVMGYSMGGFISLRLLHDSPARVRRAIIAGVGDNYYGRGVLETEAIAAALRTSDPQSIAGDVPRLFRLFAEQGKNDLEALALCMTRRRTAFSAEDMRHATAPALIVLGDRDTITGPADMLSQALPCSRVAVVPNRDHMTTVGDKAYKAAVLSFLAEA